jgi:hypothetical protein
MVGTAVREEGMGGGGLGGDIRFKNRNGSTRRVEEKGNHRRRNTTLIDICSTSNIQMGIGTEAYAQSGFWHLRPATEHSTTGLGLRFPVPN